MCGLISVFLINDLPLHFLRMSFLTNVESYERRITLFYIYFYVHLVFRINVNVRVGGM